MQAFARFEKVSPCVPSRGSFLLTNILRKALLRRDRNGDRQSLAATESATSAVVLEVA